MSLLLLLAAFIGGSFTVLSFISFYIQIEEDYHKSEIDWIAIRETNILFVIGIIGLIGYFYILNNYYIKI